MNQETPKLLLALDGSENARDIIRYVSVMFSPGRIRPVLFHVDIDIPDIFWDMGAEPALNFQTKEVQAWMIEHRKSLRDFLDESRQFLINAGYPPENVSVKVVRRQAGIARDIISEAGSGGYDAVVTGRKGLSRIKDFLVGNVTCKLVGKLQTTSLIVVGKSPDTSQVLLAFDGSYGSKKAVAKAGFLLSGSDCRFTLCHVIRPIRFSSAVPRPVSPALSKAENDWYDYNRSVIEPELAEARDELVKLGFASDNVSIRVVIGDGNRAGTLVNHADTNAMDTIVIGRRGLTAIEEFILGSVSKRVFNTAIDKTVWLVS